MYSLILESEGGWQWKKDEKKGEVQNYLPPLYKGENEAKEIQLMNAEIGRERAGLSLSFCLPQRNFYVTNVGFFSFISLDRIM